MDAVPVFVFGVLVILCFNCGFYWLACRLHVVFVVLVFHVRLFGSLSS